MTTSSPQAHRFESARAARIAAIQACFQIDTTNQSHTDVVEEFQTHRLPSEDYPYLPNVDLFHHLVETCYASYENVQFLVSQSLPEEWDLESLDPVLKMVLLVAATELTHKPDTLPAPVVISEYVDIARGFCGDKEGKFANKSLDAMARQLHLPLKSPKL